MKTKILLFAALVAGFLAFGPQAQAVTISEFTVELNAQPGDTLLRQVEIYDETRTGVSVYPVVLNFTGDPTKEGAPLILTDPADLKPDRAWIKFDQTKIDLPADGSLVSFHYRVEVPMGAEPGTHLLSLVYQSLPPETTSQGVQVSIGTNVATNIFLKVAGATIDNIAANLQVGEFTKRDQALPFEERKASFQPKTFFFKPPVDFLVTVANNGNTHQKPDGNIRVSNDLFGGTFEKITVNRTNRIILPGSSRMFEVESFGNGFMIGKYRAKLTMLYGSPLRETTAEVSFWIVPVVELSILLGILLLLIIAIIILRKIAKRKRQQSSRKQQVKEEAMRKKMEKEVIEKLAKRRPKKKSVPSKKLLSAEPPPVIAPPAVPKPQRKKKPKPKAPPRKAGAATPPPVPPKKGKTANPK